jgi:hypothetical protein
MKRIVMTLLVGGLSVCVVSMECAAQQAHSFEQLQVLVKPGDNIYVTDSAGNTSKGRISELTRDSLGLMVKGTRRDLSESDIFEIKKWRHDSLKNGALIGAGTALTLTTIFVAAYCGSGGCDAGAAAGAVLVYTGVGAAIGTGIDALIPAKQSIYHNTNRTSRKVQIRPIINRFDKGVKVAFSF